MPDPAPFFDATLAWSDSTFQAPVLLAQNGEVGLPTGAPSAAGADPGGNGAAPSAGPLGGNFLLVLVGLFVIMIILTSIGPRREKKRRESMISAVKKHDRVQTVGGVIGAIVELKPDVIVLKVDESANTRITFARSAIQQVLTSSRDKNNKDSDADLDPDSATEPSSE